MNTALKFIRDFEFFVNEEKSNLLPTQQLECLTEVNKMAKFCNNHKQTPLKFSCMMGLVVSMLEMVSHAHF